MIEAAKGGHTEIVKLLLEYPKSVTQRTQILNAVQSSLSNENDREGEPSGLNDRIPGEFIPNISFTRRDEEIFIIRSNLENSSRQSPNEWF